jgi:hypothetical protein
MSESVPSGPMRQLVFVIDGMKTLPLYRIMGQTLTEIPAFGTGNVRIGYSDPDYESAPYRYTPEWLIRIGADAALAKQIVQTWQGHLGKYLYFVQFRDDPSRDKVTALHDHTALISALCDARLGIDTSELFEAFDIGQIFERIHSEYRKDANREENYQRYADRLEKMHNTQPSILFLGIRLIERIARQIESKAAIWATLPPLLHPAAATAGDAVIELKWDKLTPKDFERLLFTLISFTEGYENPSWLTHTNAPDDGRDLSVQRVFQDKLAGTKRQRGIIACKLWTSKSVDLSEVTLLKDQMSLWQPPRVDFLVLATSGRFTTQAIRWIEIHNQGDSALSIEMWAGSHFEKLLAERPALVEEFKLR